MVTRSKKAKRNICIALAVLLAIVVILLAAMSWQGQTQAPTGNTGASTSQKTASDKAAGTDGKEDTDTAQQEQSGQSGQGNSIGGGSATPAGGNGGGSSSGGSEPGPSQHEHTWVQQQVGTESVWIVDQSAWDEKVAVGSHIECTCGINWGTNIEAAVGHCAETGCTRTVVTDFDWVHHDEVGHYEDRAIYQTVCSGCGAVA